MDKIIQGNRSQVSQQIVKNLENEKMHDINFFVDGELPPLNTQI